MSDRPTKFGYSRCLDCFPKGFTRELYLLKYRFLMAYLISLVSILCDDYIML